MSTSCVARVDAGLAGYAEAQGLNAFSDIETRLRSIPGATGASVAATLPFATLGFGEMVRRAGTGASPDRKSVGAQWNAIGASYFDTLGLALKRGRAFADAETRQPGSPRVGIIDEGLARELWPQSDPIGQSLEFEPRNALEPPSPPIEIVGVVGAISDDAFDKTPGRAVYVPFAQGCFRRGDLHRCALAAADRERRGRLASRPTSDQRESGDGSARGLGDRSLRASPSVVRLALRLSKRRRAGRGGRAYPPPFFEPAEQRD